MNKITIIGRLTREAVLKETNSKIPYVRFTVACKSKQKDETGEQKTDFFNCIAWRGLAEVVSKYCKKGDQVGISGSMSSKTRKTEEGINTIDWELNVEDLDLLSTGNKVSENGGNRAVKNGGIDDYYEDSRLPF